MLSRSLVIPSTLDIAGTLRGTKAPLFFGPTEATWITRTPEGIGSLQLQRTSEEAVRARAWGPGAAWLLDQAPRLLGSEDDATSFQPDGAIGELWRRRPFVLGRTDRPWDSIVAGILGQKVQVENARHSRRMLARTFGDPAPGPPQNTQTASAKSAAQRWVLPSPDVVAELGYYELHPIGIERKRAETLVRAAAEMRRLPNLTDRTPAQVQARLRKIRGIGPWTAAMVTATSMGDPDAVPVGDYHMANTIAWVMARESRGTDHRMLELLEPYVGHRWRVLRLAKGTGGAPKYGPRLGLHADGLHRGL